MTRRPRSPSAAVLAASTLVVARRALLRFIRTPQEVVAATATTAMFMLIFLWVFGGEIDIAGLAYADFLVPGYLATAALFVGMGTATAVAEDLERGVVDRLRSLPMPRPAFLAGRAMADTAVLAGSLAVAGLIGAAAGFRLHGGPLEALAAAGLLLLFGFAVVWLFILLGLLAGSPRAAQGLSFLVFPLTFLSSAYVRIDALPGWLQPFAQHQPLTPMVDAVRALALGPAGEALGTGAPVALALLWTAGILAVAAPLAVIRYGRG